MLPAIAARGPIAGDERVTWSRGHSSFDDSDGQEERMRTPDAVIPRDTASGLSWAALSLGAFVAAAFVSLPVAIGFGGLLRVPETAAFISTWGCLAIVSVLGAGRIAFRGWLPVNVAALSVAAIGIGLAVGVDTTLHEWATARLGYYDPDQVWWSAGLFAVLIGLATATFGVLVAPRGYAWRAAAFALAGAAGVLFIVLSNVPGLRDGIEAESWPVAIWIGLGGAYALATAALAVFRAKR
jgi:predicted lysophospholipase L1 biosynthesis ABC-type transport system permease subunit